VVVVVVVDDVLVDADDVLVDAEEEKEEEFRPTPSLEPKFASDAVAAVSDIGRAVGFEELSGERELDDNEVVVVVVVVVVEVRWLEEDEEEEALAFASDDPRLSKRGLESSVCGDAGFEEEPVNSEWMATRGGA